MIVKQGKHFTTAKIFILSSSPDHFIQLFTNLPIGHFRIMLSSSIRSSILVQSIPTIRLTHLLSYIYLPTTFSNRKHSSSCGNEDEAPYMENEADVERHCSVRPESMEHHGGVGPRQGTMERSLQDSLPLTGRWWRKVGNIFTNNCKDGVDNRRTQSFEDGCCITHLLPRYARYIIDREHYLETRSDSCAAM